MEKLLPARLFVKEPTPDFAAQMLHSYQREQPCANTRHGAIPTPEGVLHVRMKPKVQCLGVDSLLY